MRGLFPKRAQYSHYILSCYGGYCVLFCFIRRNGGEIFQKIISSSGSHSKESEVMRMYVTYQDMMMFTALLVEVVGLVIAILSYADNKKK